MSRRIPCIKHRHLLLNASRRVDITDGTLDQATAGPIADLAAAAIVLFFEGRQGAQGVGDGAGGNSGESRDEGDEEGFEVHFVVLLTG